MHLAEEPHLSAPPPRLRRTYAQAVRRGVFESLRSVANYSTYLLISLYGVNQIVDQQFRHTLPEHVEQIGIDKRLLSHISPALRDRIYVLKPDVPVQSILHAYPFYSTNISGDGDLGSFARKHSGDCKVSLRGIRNEKIVSDRRDYLGIGFEAPEKLSLDEIKLATAAHEVRHCDQKDTLKKPAGMLGHPHEEADAEVYAIHLVEKLYPNSYMRTYALATAASESTPGHSALAIEAVLYGRALPDVEYIRTMHSITKTQGDLLIDQIINSLKRIPRKVESSGGHPFQSFLTSSEGAKFNFDASVLVIAAEILLSQRYLSADFPVDARRLFQLRVAGYATFYPYTYKRALALAQFYKSDAANNLGSAVKSPPQRLPAIKIIPRLKRQ
ncbi:MAG: hypothetical protein EBQ96_07850 [Proteobacteria bacterium]|nr:hypothetical protein [Pseudomonadota bacterium]